MNHIVSASLLILTGICVYAAINHAFISYQRPFSRVHFLFSLLCITLTAFELLHLFTYSADTIPQMVFMLKWELTAILLAMGIFPWFISEYSGIRPQWLLVGITASIVLMLLINIFEPYSLQYLDVKKIEQLQMFWGERISRPVGQAGTLYYVGATVVLIVFVFSLYALFACYHRNRMWTTLFMLLAIGVFVATGIEGILVRLSIINFIHLGPFGILAMIIAMSMAINQEMQQKLTVTENRFRSLVEQSPFSIQILSPDGSTIQVNSAWEKLWGITQEDIKNYNLLNDPQLRDKGITPYLEQGFTGTAIEIPPVNYTPVENNVLNGTYNEHWIRAYIYPIKDVKGNVREVVMLHEDVTDKKRFEDTIHFIATGVTETGEGFFRQLAQNLSQLFEARYAFIGVIENADQAHVTTIAASENGKLVPNFNYSLKGTPCENVIGKRTCIYPDNVQKLFPEDGLLVEMGVEGYVGTPLFDVDGEPSGIIVLLDNRPLSNADHMKGVMEIIAARAAAELERLKADDLLKRQRRHLQEMVDSRTKALQATLKELEAFSYSVSHDLRAPLRSIDGFSQAILEDYFDKLDVLGKDYLTRIRNNTQRMALLIDNLLQLSRVNRKEMNMQSVNISNLVRDTLKKFQEDNPKRQVQIKITPDIIMRGDAELLTIVIDNLVSNAWKYTEKKQQAVIEFGTENQKGKPVCYIRDNGIGFDMKNASTIFGAFQRLHSAEDFEGTGIGLATVMRIIRRHGGNIWAVANPNEGATFYFTLPDSSPMGYEDDGNDSHDNDIKKHRNQNRNNQLVTE